MGGWGLEPAVSGQPCTHVGQPECQEDRQRCSQSLGFTLFTPVSLLLQMCVFPSLNGDLLFSIVTLILTYSECVPSRNVSCKIDGMSHYDTIIILYSEFICLNKPHEHLIHYLLHETPNFVFH